MPSENRAFAPTGRHMELASPNDRNGIALEFPDHTRSALDFAHALLQGAPEGPATLGGLLLDLARAFGADGAGLAAPPEAAPVVRQRVRLDGLELSPGPWP